MNILIIGANSAIARAMARLYAQRQDRLFLCGRDAQRLEALAKDLSVRGAAEVQTACLDVTDYEAHQALLDAAVAGLGSIDLVLVCHGLLSNQEACEADFAATGTELHVNGVSVVSLLTRLRPVLEKQGSGCIAVITSVAGDRGRQPTYIYGAAKAMVSTYLQGLRGRLLEHGVHVVDIRPGPVDTPMTAHLKKGLLFSTPEKVAQRAVKAIDRKHNTVYAPAYWRPIMTIIKLIPESLFKRLKF